MSGLIGRKIGMTSIFDENGKNIPCTVIEAGPCVVTQVRTNAVDGYEALQLGFDDKAEKRSIKAELGHFKKAGTAAKKKVVEFKGFDTANLGDTIEVNIFEEGEFIGTVTVITDFSEYMKADLAKDERIQELEKLLAQYG
jgi:large subunit ribosomal protein L3